MLAGSWFISDIFKMNTRDNYDNIWNSIEIDSWLPFVMFSVFVWILLNYEKNRGND